MTHTARLVTLSTDECLRLLRTRVPAIGRVAVLREPFPLVLPVNYCLDGTAVVFRTAPGAKLAAAARDEPVTFEVDDVDPAWEEGWSVLVHGHARLVSDPEDLERVERLPLRPWAPGGKHHYVRISPHEVTGRRIV